MNNRDTDYTIAELFEMLKEDEGWETDTQKRHELTEAFYASVLSL